MENYIGKICPFCRTGIEENDEIIICPTCDTPHHKVCWEENEGCSIFGCTGTIKPKEEKLVCDGCGTAISSNQLFCACCGKKVMVPEKNSVPAVSSEVICTKCGAVLESDKTFCPFCGQKVSSPEGGEMTDAIAKFNQGVVNKKKRKGKAKKIFIACFLIFLLLAASVIGVYSYFNNQVNEIIDEITAIEPSPEKIKTAYDSIPSTLENLFRGKIVGAFIDEVKDNEYEFNITTISLVDEEVLDKYLIYKQVAEALDIDDKEDDTNVVKYIDAVLRLEEIRKYNDLYKCFMASMDAYSKCLDYIDSASSVYTQTVQRLYLSYAISSAEEAASAAKKNSSGDEYCKKYINALDDLADGLDYLYYGISSSTAISAIETISSIIDTMQTITEEIETIEASIPKLR